MKGDFTRRTDDPSRDYSRVLKQQGRVDLDADWNEQMEIGVRRDRTRSRDVIGRTGVPRDGGGFRVVVDDEGRLAVTRGRIYVDGILCSNELEHGDGPDGEPDVVPLDDQPELPGYDPDGPDEGVHAVFLDVWERHVTHVEDPGIKEPALDGPDTATRVQTVAQVRRCRTDLERFDEPPPCAEVPRSWERDAEPRLAARAEPGEETEDRCEPPAEGGYSGLENRLYRVEIHRKGSAAGDADEQATFKWSRDNGAVLYRAVADSLSTDGSGDAGTITLERPPRDDRLAIGADDWVEVLDRATELDGKPGVLARVEGEPRIDQGQPVLDLAVPGNQDLASLEDGEGLKVRRWDHRGSVPGDGGDTVLDEGAVPVREGEWIPLEKGVEVKFDPPVDSDGTEDAYRTGDYWLVPARSGIGEAGGGDVLWPEWEGGEGPADGNGGSGGSGTPEFRSREGIRHHHCLLAVVRHDGEDWGEPRDCRPDFPPVTELDQGGCCETVRPGESVQAAVDRVVGAGGGCVSLCRGVHRIAGPLRITGDADLVLRGEGEATVVLLEDDGEEATGGIVLEGADGVAVESMFLAGSAPGGLVRIGSGGEAVRSSRRVRLSDLTVLNLAGPVEASLPSSLRVGPAEDVTVEGCRLAAAAGITAAWGESLPALPDLDMPGDGELPEPGAPRYGRGVSDLALRDTAIRYRKAGVFALRSEGWRVDRAEVRPWHQSEWRNLRALWSAYVEGDVEAAAPAAEAAGWRLRQAAGSLFRRPPGRPGACWASEEGSTAILAHLWRDSEIRDSVLEGHHGMRAWWWLRGGARGNRVRSRGAGFQAYWLHDARWADNRVTATESALSMGGTYRSRIKGNSCRADVGVGTVATPDAGAGITRQRRLAAKAYGEGESAPVTDRVIPWLMVEDLVDLAGLREVVDGLQELVDRVAALLDREDRYPLTLLLAVLGLRAFGDDRTSTDAAAAAEKPLGLPVIDLRVENNRLRGGSGCISLDGFVPLGSLRIAGNRAVTPTGRGVRVRAQPLLANAEFLHGWFRRVLEGLPGVFGWLSGFLLAVLEERADQDLGPAKEQAEDVVRLLRTQVRGWSRQAENFLDADFRIETNTVRSVRTGVETNLFQVSVARNHVTMIESGSVPAGRGEGVVTGTVRTEFEEDGEDREGGGPLAGVQVVVCGTEIGTLTGEDGRYRIAGVPAGKQELLVQLIGYGSSTRVVEVPPDGTATANFVLGTDRIDTFMSAADGGNTRRDGRDMQLLQPDWNPRPSNTEILRVIRVLEGAETPLAELGGAMREGTALDVPLYVDHLVGQDGPLAGPEARPEAAQVVAAVGNLASDEELSDASGKLASALQDGDGQRQEPLARFVRSLQRYVDSGGIRVHGAGGRIVENRVQAPGDADPETQALGGIQVSFSLARVREFQKAVEGLWELVGTQESSATLEGGSGEPAESRGLPDVPGVSETLVARNEVRGGVGHGISVQGSDGLPDLIRDLRIVENEVHRMAGAGLRVGENALVAGLKVGDNVVRLCGGTDGFSSDRGGLVLRTAVACEVRGNRVVRCGGATDGRLYGVEVEAVYGLRLTDNEISANGAEGPGSVESGGLSLRDVYGPVQVHDNEILRNRGRSIVWSNASAPDDTLFPRILVETLARRFGYEAGLAADVGSHQASVQDNVIRAGPGNLLPNLPTVQIENLQELIFTGNSCRGRIPDADLAAGDEGTSSGTYLCVIRNVARGVVADNLFRTRAGRSLLYESVTRARGVVHGNVGDAPVIVAAPDVEYHHNVPPVP